MEEKVGVGEAFSSTLIPMTGVPPKRPKIRSTERRQPARVGQLVGNGDNVILQDVTPY